MAIEVFWGSGSPYAWRVLLALELKGLAYDSRLISFSAREHKTPEFLAMNPRGKVPVLRHDGLVVSESLAILAYLDRAFPDTPLFGSSPSEAAEVWRWVASFDAYLEGPLQRDVVRPIFFGVEDADALQRGVEAVRSELALWQEAIGDHGFVVGDRASAADVVLYPAVMALERACGKPAAAEHDIGLMPLDQTFPGIAAWRARLEALPGVDRTYPPHWRASA